MSYMAVNCVFLQCGKRAVIHGGHVHLENETLFAGFCGRHHKKRKVHPVKNCKLLEGCFGKWKKEYGAL